MKRFIFLAFMALAACVSNLSIATAQVENSDPQKCTAWENVDKKSTGYVEYHNNHLHLYHGEKRVATYTVQCLTHTPSLKKINIIFDGWQWYPVITTKDMDGNRLLEHLVKKETRKSEYAIATDKYGRYSYFE